MPRNQQKAIREQLSALVGSNSPNRSTRRSNLKRSSKKGRFLKVIKEESEEKQEQPKESPKNEVENVHVNCQLFKTVNHWTGTTKIWDAEFSIKELRRAVSF